MEFNAGGNGARPGSCLAEGIIGYAFLFRQMEALRLQIEHGPVAAAQRHELVVVPKLDHPAMLEHTNAIGMTDGREAMRDEDSRAVPGSRQQAIEDFRFSADVELRGR